MVAVRPAGILLLLADQPAFAMQAEIGRSCVDQRVKPVCVCVCLLAEPRSQSRFHLRFFIMDCPSGCQWERGRCVDQLTPRRGVQELSLGEVCVVMRYHCAQLVCS